MIDKKSRRVLIINNIQSENIDQAIFILKSTSQTKRATKDISAEAQTIINNYINRVEQSKYIAQTSDKKRKKLPLWLKFLFTTIAVAVLLSFMF